jgi:hypothetical protein
LRRVCRATLVVCTPVEEVLGHRRRPLARVDGISDFAWWTPNMAGLRRWVEAAGFESIETGRPFVLPTTTGGGWKGRRGVVRAQAPAQA